jgi:hypothetical protein
MIDMSWEKAYRWGWTMGMVGDTPCPFCYTDLMVAWTNGRAERQFYEMMDCTSHYLN